MLAWPVPRDITRRLALSLAAVLPAFLSGLSDLIDHMDRADYPTLLFGSFAFVSFERFVSSLPCQRGPAIRNRPF
jgi:hypothetical protein